MNGMTISNGWVYCTWAVIAYVIARITLLSHLFPLFCLFSPPFSSPRSRAMIVMDVWPCHLENRIFLMCVCVITCMSQRYSVTTIAACPLFWMSSLFSTIMDTFWLQILRCCLESFSGLKCFSIFVDLYLSYFVFYLSSRALNCQKIQKFGNSAFIVLRWLRVETSVSENCCWLGMLWCWQVVVFVATMMD